jgi:hypothetical protein
LSESCHVMSLMISSVFSPGHEWAS